nr:hypothetical protein [Tanacetum cinerariifolium]
GSGSGPGRQETIGGVMAQNRSEGALIQSTDPPFSLGYTVRSGEDRMEHDIELTGPVPQTPYDSPLSGGHTPESDKGSMTLKELTDLCITLLQKVLDLENVKIAQTKEIASLKKRVTKLEQTLSSRILGFHPFRDGTSKRHSLGRKKVSKQGRKNLKSQQIFQDIVDVLDEDADTEMIVKNKGQKLVLLNQRTPPTTTTLFDDEDVTVADTLVKMKNQKANEKRIAFKDVDDSARPIRSITTLQPIPTIDPKDKGKGILPEPKPVNKTKKKDQDQIERDVEDLNKMNRALEVERKEQQVVLDDDKAIDYKTLDVKILIVDCESQVLGTNKAGDVHVYKLTRLDGSYRYFLTFSKMLKVLDRQDVLNLHNIIMERFPANDPEGYDLILWGDLKTLVKSSEDDEIWKNQQDWKLLSWKLYEACGVHTLMLMIL